MGVGCWALGGPDPNLGLPMGWGSIEDTEAQAGLERAYALGATLFDTADVYGHGRSERLLGWLVAQVPRASLVLSSKVGYFRGTAPHGYQPVHIRHQLEQSLDNLRTDYLDIYFFHHAEFGDNDTVLDAAIETMVTLRTEDVVRIALWSCLQRYEHAAVLVGFTSPEQIAMNLSCLRQPPTSEELSTAREIMAGVQARLDASGEVFLDESPAVRTL